MFADKDKMTIAPRLYMHPWLRRTNNWGPREIDAALDLISALSLVIAIEEHHHLPTSQLHQEMTGEENENPSRRLPLARIDRLYLLPWKEHLNLSLPQMLFSHC
jgi:hypothetical protein